MDLIPDAVWIPAYDADGQVRDGAWVVEVTGLTNLPLHGFHANRIWIEIVWLACELTAWMQMLALADHPARRWEPKRLRLRLFSAARLTRHARRTRLRFTTHWSWSALITTALTRLQPG